jgi:hypothetical protein
LVSPDPAAPDWERILPFDPVPLTDEQWTEIVGNSSLPTEARPIIGRAIALYRRYQANIDASKSAAETRAELDRLREHAEVLRMGLETAMANPTAHFALTVPLPPPGGWIGTVPESRDEGHRRLANSLDDLRRIEHWIGLARDRIQPQKPGAKRRAAPAGLLVHNLNHILVFRHKHVNPKSLRV